MLVDPALAAAPDLLVGSGTAGVEVGIDIYALVTLTNARWVPMGEPAARGRRRGRPSDPCHAADERPHAAPDRTAAGSAPSQQPDHGER